MVIILPREPLEIVAGVIYGKPKPQEQRRYNRVTNRYFDPSSRQKLATANLLRFERMRRSGHGVVLEPLEGPLFLWVTFKFRATQRRHHGYHTATPDLDNCVKFFLDAMQIARYFNNDSQVVRVIASKTYCTEDLPEARTQFRLYRVEN